MTNYLVITGGSRGIGYAAIERFLKEENAPYSFYFHPWEIDPDQPRVKGAPLLSKFRHYVNLSRMENKLIHLLDDYEWSSMKSVYSEFL